MLYICIKLLVQKMISNCMRNATPSKRVEFIFKPIAIPHSRIFFRSSLNSQSVHMSSGKNASSSLSDSFLAFRKITYTKNSSVEAANLVSTSVSAHV